MTADHHRVLVVGPWRGGGAVGGCCSAPPDGLTDISTTAGGPGLPRHDADGHDAGHHAHHAVAVVRALRSALDAEVDVQLVDPRNTAFLVPTVYRDARAHGARRRHALVEAIRSTTPWALVVDGRTVSRAIPLTPDAALARLPADIPRLAASR